jgi:methionyl-tRNA synthetase
MSEQPTTSTIQFDDFAKVQLRVARVLEAFEHPKADKLMVLKVDLGTEQRQICAGIRGQYTPEQLVGRNIIVVANLAPRMMRGLESNGMLLAASNADHSRVILLTPDADIEPGSSVS